jgi:MGT family glycosyltransferase
MRLLFSTTPYYGHFHPLVSLARRLLTAGHEIAFASTPDFCKKIGELGFQTFEVGHNPTADMLYTELPSVPAENLNPAQVAVIHQLVTIRQKLPDLIVAGENWQPQIIVRENLEWSAILAAEYLGIPHVCVQATAYGGLPAHQTDENKRWLDWLSVELDKLRREWKLQPDPKLASLYHYLLLSFAPPAFHDPAIELPATVRFVRPIFFDASLDTSLPAWNASLPPRPTVYACLGTQASRLPFVYPGIFRQIIEGLADLPLNLILTTGRPDIDPADLGTLPTNVYVERYIPQTLIEPFCDLMITHGGNNTLLSLLNAAIPMLVIPIFGDQLLNARLVRAQGVGRVLNPLKLQPDRIRRAVIEILAADSYRQNARRLQRQLHSLPTLDFAVNLLEELATLKPASSENILLRSP